MERDFSDRTVLVTGAAGNLGAAVAAEFAQRGANLVVMDLNGEALAKAYGTWAQTVAAPVDLLEQAQVDTAVERVVARFGRIDVLVNLAGGFRMGEPPVAAARSSTSAPSRRSGARHRWAPTSPRRAR
jgi:NAD(P)-dependent dehydrogenase (short-subunit alcohol dehydrogenase family)